MKPFGKWLADFDLPAKEEAQPAAPENPAAAALRDCQALTVVCDGTDFHIVEIQPNTSAHDSAFLTGTGSTLPPTGVIQGIYIHDYLSSESLVSPGNGT
jgi:hypothetical protein